MEHVTTIWKTTLALVLRNLQDKTVKVCLVFVCLFSHYFLTVLFPCSVFFVLIVYCESPILTWLKMSMDTALFAAKNHCYSSPCQNNGNCSNLPDTYKCTCHPGFTGQNCEGELYLNIQTMVRHLFSIFYIILCMPSSSVFFL